MIDTAHINLPALIEQESGIKYHSSAMVHGVRELHYSCPWCPGTTDSFVIQLLPEGARYSHAVPGRRGCGRFGDAIQFVQEWRGFSFPEAMDYLELDLSQEKQGSYAYEPHLRPSQPSDKWMESAAEFAAKCHHLLFTNVGKKALEWLHQRGFTDQTLLEFQIGFLPRKDGNEFQPFHYAEWGLISIDEVNSNSPIFHVPYGIIIPYYKKDKIHKLEIRKSTKDKDRYQTIRGSVDTLFNQNNLSITLPCILTEGAFDAMSGSQILKNEATFVATGGTKYKEAWIPQIKKSPRIFVSFDSRDKAGDRTRKLWKESLPQVISWAPSSHDLNDMLKNQIDIQKWFKLGMEFADVIDNSADIEMDSIDNEHRQSQQQYSIESGMTNMSRSLDNYRNFNNCVVCNISLIDPISEDSDITFSYWPNAFDVWYPYCSNCRNPQTGQNLINPTPKSFQEIRDWRTPFHAYDHLAPQYRDKYIFATDDGTVPDPIVYSYSFRDIQEIADKDGKKRLYVIGHFDVSAQTMVPCDPVLLAGQQVILSQKRQTCASSRSHLCDGNEKEGADSVGNYWCAECQERRQFMQIGQRQGYPELHKAIRTPAQKSVNRSQIIVKAGESKWSLYAQIMPIWQIQEAIFFAKGGIKDPAPISRKKKEMEEVQEGPSSGLTTDLLKQKIKKLNTSAQTLLDNFCQVAPRGSFIYKDMLLGGGLLEHSLVDDLLDSQYSSRATDWLQTKIQKYTQEVDS